jgi:hypothetical protein
VLLVGVIQGFSLVALCCSPPFTFVLIGFVRPSDNSRSQIRGNKRGSSALELFQRFCSERRLGKFTTTVITVKLRLD